MLLAIGLTIITHWVFPVVFLVWLWRGRERSRLRATTATR